MRRLPKFPARMDRLVDALRHDQDQLLRLGASESLVHEMVVWQVRLVAALRERGVTWDEIAEALGMTRPGVLWRFGAGQIEVTVHAPK